MNLAKKKPHENYDWEAERENIIRELRTIQNPLLLTQIKNILRDSAHQNQLNKHQALLQTLLKEEDPAERILHIQIPAKQASRLSRYERWSAKPAFWLATFALIVAGILITTLTSEAFRVFEPLEGMLLLLYSSLCILMMLDLSAVLYLARRDSVYLPADELVFRLFAILFPPLRIASRDMTAPKHVWLPYWQWSYANHALFEQLRRKFSIPMIIIALCILPVLIIEWKFYDQLQAALPGTDLGVWLEMVQTFIWVAFTFEFILMFSVTNEKVEYCLKNWVDILIILLPLISFFRTLRLIRMIRLKYLARTYKLRGLVTKGRQGLVLINFFDRLQLLRPEMQLKSLQKKLQENRRERDALERKLIALLHHLEEREQREGKMKAESGNPEKHL